MNDINNINDTNNESISKGLEEALKTFESKNKEVPVGYFDQFELDLMQKIMRLDALPLCVTLIRSN